MVVVAAVVDVGALVLLYLDVVIAISILGGVVIACIIVSHFRHVYLGLGFLNSYLSIHVP